MDGVDVVKSVISVISMITLVIRGSVIWVLGAREIDGRCMKDM